jgi:hypothetical protein
MDVIGDVMTAENEIATQEPSPASLGTAFTASEVPTSAGDVSISLPGPSVSPPDDKTADTAPLKATGDHAPLSDQGKLELAALKCVAGYGGVEQARVHLTKRAATDSDFIDTVKCFDAWAAGGLSQYLETRFPSLFPRHQPIKTVSDIPLETTNAHSAR